MARAVSTTQQATRRARPIAATVTGAFLVAGVCWIMVTDVLLYQFISDPVLIARFETAKGWLFTQTVRE